MNERFDKGLMGTAIHSMQPHLEHLNAFEKMEVLGTIALMEAINLGCGKESVSQMFRVMGERMIGQFDTFLAAQSLMRGDVPSLNTSGEQGK